MAAADVAEAGLQLSCLFGDCRVSAPHPGLLGMDLECAQFEHVRFLRWRFAQDAVVVFSPDSYLVCAAFEGHVVYEGDGDAITIGGPVAAIIPPSAGRRLRWTAGTALAGILIPEQDMRREAMAMPSAQARLRSAQFDMSVPPGDIFTDLIALLADDLANRPSGAGNRVVRALLDRLVVYVVARILESGVAAREPADTTTLVPRHVKQAEDYIKSHLGEPLDNDLLASVTKVSARSLYRGFLNFRGISPARYIQDLRLETVHRLLLAKGETRDIGKIAEDAGFKSYHTFWRSYVRKFGVPPSRERTRRDQ